MEENKKKSYITKETIISAIIGFLIGVAAIFLLGWSLDYIAKSAGMATLIYGEDTVATVAGKAISTQTLYDKAKLSRGLTYLINEVDKEILNQKYELTEKEEETAKKEAEAYLEDNEAMGYTEKQFLEGNGFKDFEDFLDNIRADIKYTKYLYDYFEAKLEVGAVEKYYNDNKETIETYDTEHILVKITDSVTDEQALALANEIIGKLNEGKSFDEVVEEYKDKIVHEELGYYGKDASLEQTYIDEMVALENGAYSKTPIKTSYGYHVVHKIATSTLEDLRGTIIETLSQELISADNNIGEKAFIELRKENNFEIYDETLKEQYQEYCDMVYGTEETE